MGFESEFNKWKTEYFGNFCINSCNDTCCNMSNFSLHLTEKELISMLGGRKDKAELKQQGIKQDSGSGMYFFDNAGYCPKFDTKTRMCVSYEKRPKSCRDYPFLVEPDAIIIKKGCSLDKGAPGYRELSELGKKYGKVIVKR